MPDVTADPWDTTSTVMASRNPVGWARVIGQGPAVAAMRRALRDHAVPHAWLLVGEDGIGQDGLIEAFTATLECEETGLAAGASAGVQGVLSDEGCGVCVTCRRVARGTWSPLHTFEPEGTFHLVRSVRDVWMKAALTTAVEGRRRVLRVRAADRMNEQAQNAFLKILEEPPPSVIWLLEVADDTQLLDTIHSRVRRVDLAPWTPDDLVRWSEQEVDIDLTADEAAALARVAAGSPERLRALAGVARRAARAMNLDVMRRLVQDGAHVVDQVARDVIGQGKAAEAEVKKAQAEELATLPERFGVTKKGEIPKGVEVALKERHKRQLRAVRTGALDLFLDDFGSWLRDLVVIVGRGGPATMDGSPESLVGLVNRDQAMALARDAGWFKLADLYESIAGVERCRLAFERNGSPELQLTRLLLTMAGPAWEASRA